MAHFTPCSFATWNDFYAACHGAREFGAHCGTSDPGTSCCHQSVMRWGRLLWPMLPTIAKDATVQFCRTQGLTPTGRPISCLELSTLMDCTCCPRPRHCSVVSWPSNRHRRDDSSPISLEMDHPFRLYRCLLCRRWVCMSCSPWTAGHVVGCRKGYPAPGLV